MDTTYVTNGNAKMVWSKIERRRTMDAEKNVGGQCNIAVTRSQVGKYLKS